MLLSVMLLGLEPLHLPLLLLLVLLDHLLLRFWLHFHPLGVLVQEALMVVLLGVDPLNQQIQFLLDSAVLQLADALAGLVLCWLAREELLHRSLLAEVLYLRDSRG